MPRKFETAVEPMDVDLSDSEKNELNRRYRRGQLKWWLNGQMLVVETIRSGLEQKGTVSHGDLRKLCKIIERKVSAIKRDPDAFLDPKFHDITLQ